jgi:chitinase
MSVIVLLPFLTRLTVYQHVLALLSVGGWTDSRYFSSAVATEANRTAFAKAVMAAVSQYNLDGVEFE